MLLACAFIVQAAVPSAAFTARLAAARDAAGADPKQALEQLKGLRGQAEAAQHLEARLALDEAECRVLTDLDAQQALAVADAGLAAAGAAPPATAREAWLRLRACRAGMLVEAGNVAAGRGEFEALLAQTDPQADAAVRALVKVERGAHRSRSGDLQGAQADLIEACSTLKTLEAPHDHELCLTHLAGHYTRVGDSQESLRLHQSLRQTARQRGATYDESIFTFAIGQALQAQERWRESIDSFRDAAAVSTKLGDTLGVGYAEQAIAFALLRLGQGAEALSAADKALAHLSPDTDPRQREKTLVTRAEALVAVGRAAEAVAVLDGVEAALRLRGERASLVGWWSVRALAMSSLGRWQNAYQAATEARNLERELQKQILSDQSARMRMQFNRDRDAEDLSALRRLNEQGQKLRQTQAAALALFVILLAIVLVFALRKLRQARRLHDLASTDELTGLANRRALMALVGDAIEQRRERARPLALLMIDADHFKQVNDVHGHPVGDQVLRHLARTLAACLRERDRLGRLGGEEFVAVLADTNAADAGHVAERMRQTVASSPALCGAASVALTVSIGIAAAAAGDTPASLIARADAALYRAKHAGRNAVAIGELGPAGA